MSGDAKLDELCKALNLTSLRPTADLQQELGLGEGRTNQNFIATNADGRRLFVRLGADLPAYGVSRAREQEASRAAASSGIGPEVVHTTADIIVTAMLDGPALTQAQVCAAVDGTDSTLLLALTSTLRTLHCTPIPDGMAAAADPRWAPPDVVNWIEYARHGGYDRLPLLVEADETVKEVERLAGPLAVGSSRFCHFDLLADNFVQTRGADGGIQVHVVDFEYANVGQPLMDLAVLAMGCSMTEAQERSLLAAYLQCEACPAEVHSRFTALKVLATLRETMWGVVAEVSGSSALTPADAASYTDENFAKYTAAKAALARCIGG